MIEEEIEEVVEHYIGQLKTSGFLRKQKKDIVTCGVVGWMRKLERREKAVQEQYLEAKDTLETRTDKKLVQGEQEEESRKLKYQ